MAEDLVALSLPGRLGPARLQPSREAGQLVDKNLFLACIANGFDGHFTLSALLATACTVGLSERRANGR
jgi:hypothetical protein